MKKIIFLSLFSICFHSYSQTDYSLAKAGDYVMGVYLFIGCDPVNEYDFIAEISAFDPMKIDRNLIQKIIKKARKKNPHFDGMIFKKGFKHVELIKFRGKQESVQGFNVGDIITFKRNGKVSEGKILVLDDAKQKAVIEYEDDSGEKKKMNVPLKNLSHN